MTLRGPVRNGRDAHWRVGSPVCAAAAAVPVQKTAGRLSYWASAAKAMLMPGVTRGASVGLYEKPDSLKKIDMDR